MKKPLHCLICFVFMGRVVLSQSTLINFDDLPAGGVFNSVTIANGYQGLNWNNFGVINATSLPFSSGFENGMVSSPNVAYNIAANPASFSAAGPFTVVSGDFAAAWENDLSVEVVGYNGTTTEFDNTYVLNSEGPSLLDFPNVPVTTVDFVASGGVSAGYQGYGPVFVLDNLTVAAVPEPSIWALISCSIGSLTLLRRPQK